MGGILILPNYNSSSSEKTPPYATSIFGSEKPDGRLIPKGATLAPPPYVFIKLSPGASLKSYPMLC